MATIFARQEVKCSHCGARLRECDESCPECLAERLSTRFVPLAAEVVVVAAIIVLIGAWFMMEANFEPPLPAQRAGPPNPPAPQPAADQWNEWIHTPTR